MAQMRAETPQGQHNRRTKFQLRRLLGRLATQRKKGGGCAGQNADVPNLERFTSSCHPPDHALTGETLCVSIASSGEVEDEARDGSTEAWIEEKRREGKKGTMKNTG